MFLTRMGPGPWSDESLVTTVKPRPSEPADRNVKIKGDTTASNYFSPKYPALLWIWYPHLSSTEENHTSIHSNTHTHRFKNTPENFASVLLTQFHTAIVSGLTLWAITGAAESAGVKALKMGSALERRGRTRAEQRWDEEKGKGGSECNPAGTESRCSGKRSQRF